MVDLILTGLARHAIVIKPVRSTTAPLAPDAAMQQRVISPQAFAAQLQH